MSVCARALARTFSVFMLSLSSPDDPSGCRFARAWPPSAPPEALERRSTDYRKARHFFSAEDFKQENKLTVAALKRYSCMMKRHEHPQTVNALEF